MRQPLRITRAISRSVRHQYRPVSASISRTTTPTVVEDRNSESMVWHPVLPSNGVQPDPYVDYGRWLSAEGGVLMVYKDLDLRLRHTLWRLFAWTVATGFEAWFALHRSPVHAMWINIVCLLAVAILNWLIVAKPVETYRQIEIRPDCMILEGCDVFWLRQMENGWPAFQSDDDGNRVLCGVYGTRFVEYLTLRRFDDNDRMADVFAARLQEAMQQLWTKYQ